MSSYQLFVYLNGCKKVFFLYFTFDIDFHLFYLICPSITDSSLSSMIFIAHDFYDAHDSAHDFYLGKHIVIIHTFDVHN